MWNLKYDTDELSTSIKKLTYIENKHVIVKGRDGRGDIA